MRRPPNILGQILDWQYSSVFGAGIWFAGVGAMLSDKYIAAMVSYLLGGAWLLGWWLWEHPSPKLVGNQHSWTTKQRKVLWSRWLVASLVIAVTLSMIVWTSQMKRSYDLQQLYGVLIPAQEKDPPGPCSAGAGTADEVRLYSGGSTILVGANRFSLVRIRGQEMVGIERNGNELVFNVTIKGQDGKVVAAISRNEFYVNKYSIVEPLFSRPDRSTLLITDVYGNKTRIHYANRKSLEFSGKLYYSPTGYIDFSENGLNVEPNVFFLGKNFCFDAPNATALADVN